MAKDDRLRQAQSEPLVRGGTWQQRRGWQ